MAKSRLNNIYTGMKQRCCNPKTNRYNDYGGRGIKVCDEWSNTERAKVRGCNTKGWLAFKEWALSHGYKDDLTIDRIDVNKGYSPDNCRWVTMKVQFNNRRDNNYVTYKGKTQTLTQWCEELNLCYNQTYRRIFIRNWDIEKAFEVKSNQYLKMLTYKGKTQCLRNWCKELNLNYSTMYRRITVKHWSAKKAFETVIKV